MGYVTGAAQLAGQHMRLFFLRGTDCIFLRSGWPARKYVFPRYLQCLSAERLISSRWPAQMQGGMFLRWETRLFQPYRLA